MSEGKKKSMTVIFYYYEEPFLKYSLLSLEIMTIVIIMIITATLQ